MSNMIYLDSLTGTKTIATGATGAVDTRRNAAVTTATFARPANTTAYTALDAMSDSASAPTVMTFSSAARVNAGSGFVVKAKLFSDQAAMVSQLRLHLYTVAPTAINDNAAHTLLYADRAGYIGFIDFPAASTTGTGSTASFAQKADATRLGFVCAASSKAIYGTLETVDGFTPASGQNFHVQLMIEQN